jgi:hypothetical protein
LTFQQPFIFNHYDTCLADTILKPTFARTIVSIYSSDIPYSQNINPDIENVCINDSNVFSSQVGAGFCGDDVCAVLIS